MKYFKIILVMMIICFLTVGCKKEDNINLTSEGEIIETESSDSETTSAESKVIDSIEADLIIASVDEEQLNKNEALFNTYKPVELDPVWTFDPLSNNESWSTNTPLLKPFKDESVYDVVNFTKDYKVDFKYVDENQNLQTEFVKGDYWRMTFSGNDTTTEEDFNQFTYDIKKYFELNDIDFLGQYDNEILFKYEDEARWWLKISAESDEIEMIIVKEIKEYVNREIIINPSDYEEKYVYFSVDLPEGKFITLESKLDAGIANIEIEMETSYGDYERDTEFDLALDFKESEIYIIDSFINEPGRARVKVRWRDNPPNELSILFVAKEDVDPIFYGENLGGIILSSDTVKAIEIRPTLDKSIYINHPEYHSNSIYFDRDQEGSFVTYVPAGYYDLDIIVTDGIVDFFKTLRVPVHSGKMTYVDIPESITNAFKQKEAFDEKGIFITEIQENNDQVSFIFSLIDKETRNVLPSIENSKIHEGGINCDIVSIEPIEEPMHVVLLLDSSGSMKGQMDATIESAKQFISSLPEDAIIKVVDFDSEPKPFKTISKSDQIEELDGVKAKGATALYDSVILGLEILKGSKRPALVVFTDGEDANLNDTAQGSKASIEETISLLEESNVPLYTIGFGEGHDSKTLNNFSELSLGKYYPAENQEALKLVFDAINNKLTNTYVATYNRPKEASVSDIPVVSLIVDISGSMNGSRMTDVKNILHNFIETLPDNVQIMVTGFDNDVWMYQGVTTDKLLSLNAVGSFDSSGGTNIEDSVVFGFESLSRVHSSKRIMIYLTDAALYDVPRVDNAYKEALKNLKENDIETLWIGLGVNKVEPFENVAAFTGGHFVVTEDLDLINEKFDLMLESVANAKPSTETLISLNIDKRTEQGAFESFSKSEMYELSPIKTSDEVIIQDTITYTVKDGISQYDKTMSAYVSGESIIADETIITKRIPADVTSNNEAMSVHVEEIIFSSKLYGVDAPKGQRFMGVLLEMENILPEQDVVVYPDGSGHPSSWVANTSQGKIEHKKIAYSIPNFSSHFGMSYNGDGPFPAATATWLTYEPIVVPGEYDITLFPDEKKKGMMVFIVPDEQLSQLGIHYFDNNYGHLNLAVVNNLPEIDTAFKAGEESTVNYAELFDITITGYQTATAEEEPLENSQHRIIEGKFSSEIKANLNLEPNNRFFMRIKSENGDFYTPLSERTAHTPLGLYAPTTIMPGANNAVKMLYQMPESFEDYASDMFIDLYKEDLFMEVSKGINIPADIVETFSTEYFDVDVNDVYRYKGVVGGSNKRWAIADVTIHDYKDEYASRGIGSYFSVGYTPNEDIKGEIEQTGLSNFGYEDSTGVLSRSDGTVGLSKLTSNVLFGLDDDTIIYDGTSRRGIVIFELGNEHDDVELFLMFDNTELSVLIDSDMSPLHDGLIVEKEAFDVDNSYSKELATVLPTIIKQYKLKHPKVLLTKKISEELYDDVHMPSINAYGYENISAIETEEDLIKAIRSLRFVNDSDENRFSHTFSKEALMTQGFGTEADMAQMAVDVLSRLGFKVKKRMVTVTDRGQDILRDMSGIESLEVKELPALSYITVTGNKMMVFPFARDLSELDGIVYYSGEIINKAKVIEDRLMVKFDIVPNEKGKLAQMNSMAGALGGSSSNNEGWTEKLAYFDIPRSVYSQDAVDVGVAIMGKEAYVYIDTAEGTLFSEDYIDLAFYDITGWSVNIEGSEHHVDLKEDMSADQVFMTIGYNLPELPRDAALSIDQLMKDSKSLNANTLAAMKWLHRKALYNFISSQTIFERDLDSAYELVTGRINTPRMIVIQSVIADDLTTSIDLVNIQNDLFTGDEPSQNSYRLMSGLSASQMETKALPNGIGVEFIWEKMPESAHLVLMNTIYMDDYNEDLINAGATEKMIEYFEESRKMVIIQSEPSIINQEERWAWMEIDPKTFDTISVIDTFEHGSMASNASLNSALEKAQYVIGAFKGVETSVWAVSSFSLELVGYDEILKAAKAFALGIGKNFETEIGSVTLAVGKAPALNGKAKDIFDHFKKGEPEEDSKGFKEGYVDGVNLYFKVAK